MNAKQRAAMHRLMGPSKDRRDFDRLEHEARRRADVGKVGATLLFAVHIPGIDPQVEPDQIADELVAIINEERERNGGLLGEVTVSLFPACQWFTPEVWAIFQKACQTI